MNLKFMKALHLLDKGEYEKGEENILKAIEECNNKYEMLQIKACYSELLCELERFDEAMVMVNYILENTDEDFESPERETALSVKNYIEGIEKNENLESK